MKFFLKKIFFKLLNIVCLIFFCFLLICCSDRNIDKTTYNVNTSGDNNMHTRIFIDSTGRTFNLPIEINKFAVTGNLTQIMCYGLLKNEFVGISEKLTEDKKIFLNEDFHNLPVLGQLYGGKGDLNFETLIKYAPQVVVDIGEAKNNVKDDFEKLEEKTGIPFIHIDATLDNLSDAYIKLGELFNKQIEAKVYADYCKYTYEKALEYMDEVEKISCKKKILYISGDKGSNAIAKGSYFASIIDMVGDNVFSVNNPSARGIGNEVDMEQIIKLNPDVIFFESNNLYNKVKNDDIWKDISAIKNNNYYKVPLLPYNIMGFPPSVQKLLGLRWSIKILYPDICEWDIEEDFKEFYNMFYLKELSTENFRKIVE